MTDTTEPIHDSEGNDLAVGDLIYVAGVNKLYRARVTGFTNVHGLVNIRPLKRDPGYDIAVNPYQTLRYSSEYRGMAEQYIIALLNLKN